jgi:integrase
VDVEVFDLALLTGQRISDLIKLRWQDVGVDGIYVQQQKTKGFAGPQVDQDDRAIRRRQGPAKGASSTLTGGYQQLGRLSIVSANSCSNYLDQLDGCVPRPSPLRSCRRTRWTRAGVSSILWLNENSTC